MSGSAQQIQLEFARLASEEAGTLYLEQLLQDGFGAWPDTLQRRFPDLQLWGGLPHLKRRLQQLTGASPESGLLFASRSAELMSLAAKLTFDRCTNVLTTDLSWPYYQRILEREARRRSRSVTRLRLRKRILSEQIDCQTLINSIVASTVRHRCDGLFLPLVDNLGVRLPVEEIASAIRRQTDNRFIVVDGAQAIGHVPFSLAGDWCDLFLAGCHKWLRAYNPLGLAFFGHARSVDGIQSNTQALLSKYKIDDPLLRFTTDMESGRASRYGETVSLLPLFTAAGAIHDALGPPMLTTRLKQRLKNANRLVELSARQKWRALRPAQSLRTGICLLRSKDEDLNRVSPNVLRQLFHDAGLAVSGYRGGLVRLSMPATHWTESEESHLITALAAHQSRPTGVI